MPGPTMRSLCTVATWNGTREQRWPLSRRSGGTRGGSPLLRPRAPDTRTPEEALTESCCRPPQKQDQGRAGRRPPPRIVP
eukprot:2434983-Pyramimonas_sp.AAC.1